MSAEMSLDALGYVTSSQVFVTMLEVKVDLVCDLRSLGSFDGLCAEESRDRDDNEGKRNTAEHGGRSERLRKSGYGTWRI